MDINFKYQINDALTAIAKEWGLTPCDQHLNDATHAAANALMDCESNPGSEEK